MPHDSWAPDKGRVYEWAEPPTPAQGPAALKSAADTIAELFREEAPYVPDVKGAFWQLLELVKALDGYYKAFDRVRLQERALHDGPVGPGGV